MQQLHRRDPERHPGHDLRDDGRPRAAARRPQARAGFDTLTYISMIVPEIVIASATLVFFATGFDFVTGRPSASALKLRLPDDHRGARALQHEPRAAARARPPVGHGPDADRRERGPVRDAVADVPPDHVPAAPAGDRGRASCCRSRSASTTTSSRRSSSGPGSSTLPLYIFGQVRRGVTPGDQRGRHDDAGVHPAAAADRPARAHLAGAPAGPARRRWRRWSRRPTPRSRHRRSRSTSRSTTSTTGAGRPHRRPPG